MKQILALSFALLLAVACVKDIDAGVVDMTPSSKIINTATCATEGSLLV